MFDSTFLQSTATSPARASGTPDNMPPMVPREALEALSEDAPTLTLQTFHKDFGERQVELTASVVNGEPWFRGK